MTTPAIEAAAVPPVTERFRLARETIDRLVWPASTAARWKQVERDDYGSRWMHRSNGLRVIYSVLPYGPEGELWQHVSVSRASRLPSWEDLKLVRSDFIGDHTECYQVFPPRERWVNDGPYVLHLWASIARANGVLPDFRIAGTI